MGGNSRSGEGATIIQPAKAQLVVWYFEWLMLLVLCGLPLLLLALLLQDPEVRVLFFVMFAVLLLVMILSLIWIPLYFHRLRYGIEPDVLRMEKGVLWRKRATVPYSKITNVDITQGPLQRLFGVGKLQVQTAGYGGQSGGEAEIVFAGVTAEELDTLRDEIMTRVKRVSASSGESAAGAGEEITGETERELLRKILAELQEMRKKGKGGG